MRIRYIQRLAFLFFIFIAVCSCKSKPATPPKPVVYKGLYSFGPEIKSFKDCDNQQEFWVTDSSATLELQYSQMNFEKPYEPVYVEVEGVKLKSGKEGMGSEYDSTLVVKKVVKITKEIPQDMCN
jgi:copper homeostasis protein (lipoprotein)